MPDEVVEMEVPGTMETVGVIAFRNNNKEVLCVKYLNAYGREGLIGLPGGQIRPGESPQEAAAREFKEETGIDILPIDLQPFANNFVTAEIVKKDGSVRHGSMKAFGLRQDLSESDAELKTFEAEKLKPLWMNVEELKKMRELNNPEELEGLEGHALMPNTHLIIEKYLSSTSTK